MESLERTPTPRETLFSVQQHLQKIMTNEHEFYSELSKRVDGEVIAEDDTDHLATAITVHNEIFTAVTTNEYGEKTGEINLLGILKDKFRELSEKIQAALEDKAHFGSLLILLQTEQLLIRGNTLFADLPENDDAVSGINLDILANWYRDFIEQTIESIDKISDEPEFDLPK